MRHRTALPISDDTTRGGWESAARPDRRLSAFAVVAMLPLLFVLIRLGDLQSEAGSLIGSGVAARRSILEPIPARDGRILSADGQVLAEDVERFDVLVQYRWLERPADPTWLRGEALRRLSPQERRDPDHVATAEADVEKRRESLWTSLAERTGQSREQLFAQFAVIQERVAAIRRAVEQRRQSKDATARNDPSPPQARTWWQHVWQTAAKAVTTPPRPGHDEPLILAEELDAHEVASGLPIAAAAAIEADRDRYPGTTIRVASRRRYPHGATAAHVIGYRFARPDAAGEDAVVTSTGQTGIERAYDRHLRGIDGVRRVWIDRHGEPVRTEVLREPRVGLDVVLHLDLGLQTAVERLLDEALANVRTDDPKTAVPDAAGGAIVVLDVRTGAVLAAASGPRFDLGGAATRSRRLWENVQSDPAKPLFDRVATAAVPPGSVFKPVTAAALLESGKVDPDVPFDCRGYLDRKDRHRDFIFTHFGVGHGPTTLAVALAESCNVYFFHGTRLTGPSILLEQAANFGFGRPTGIDLPSEAAGNLVRNPREADALGLSIGQAELTATPLQVARMTAAIANGGRLVTPHVVRGSGPAQQGGASVRPILATGTLPDLRPDTLARIREGLERTIAHPRGTGYKTARHPKVAIAGKTGTAEVGGGRPDHAWFAGYAPAGDPQIAFVILLEHAGSGSQAAGPVARGIVDALLTRGLLR